MKKILPALLVLIACTSCVTKEQRREQDHQACLAQGVRDNTDEMDLCRINRQIARDKLKEQRAEEPRCPSGSSGSTSEAVSCN